jgi:YHS domain-containing protein
MDYKGQRIYFCCQGCDAEFKKDPEKYLKKIKEQGITLEKCPEGK